jgi:DNA polymerase alpha subunit A
MKKTNNSKRKEGEKQTEVTKVQPKRPKSKQTDPREGNQSASVLFPQKRESLDIWIYDIEPTEEVEKGEVRLWGKIFRNGEFKSAVLIVKGITKTLFAVPKQAILNKMATQLAALDDSDEDYPDKAQEIVKNLLSSVNLELDTKFSQEMKEIQTFLINKRAHITEHLCEGVSRGEVFGFEFEYPFSYGPVPSKLLSGQGYRHIFGHTQDIVETFCLKKKIKGPVWMKVKDFKIEPNGIYKTKYVFQCGSMESIEKIEDKTDIPPLCVLFVSPIKKRRENGELQLIGLDCAFSSDYKIDTKTESDDVFKNSKNISYVTSTDSFWHVNFFKDLDSYDPDVICGHGLIEEDLSHLISKTYMFRSSIVPRESSKEPLKSFSRVNSSVGYANKLKSMDQVTRNIKLCTGRIPCDTRRYANIILRSPNRDLNFLLKESGYSGSKDSPFSVAHLMNFHGMLQFTYYLSSISGQQWIKVLNRKKSGIAENLLNHEFYGNYYIIPDKVAENKSNKKRAGGSNKKKNDPNQPTTEEKQPIQERDELDLEDLECMENETINKFSTKSDSDAKKGKQKPKKPSTKKKEQKPPTVHFDGNDPDEEHFDEVEVRGGLNIEPVVGFVETISVLIDIKSAYPSAFIEKNICPSVMNIEGTYDPLVDPESIEEGMNEDSQIEGVIPKLMKALVFMRSEFSKRKNDKELDENARYRSSYQEQTVKTATNVIYGCLAMKGFRWYSPHHASQVTATIRDCLETAIEIVNNKEIKVTDPITERESIETLQVIAGITDSMIINTKVYSMKSAESLAKDICNEFNKRYENIQIRVENFFPLFNVYKKNNYIGIKLTNDGKYETLLKGLTGMSRSFPPIANSCAQQIADIYFKTFMMQRDSPTGDFKNIKIYIEEYLAEFLTDLETIQDPWKFCFSIELNTKNKSLEQLFRETFNQNKPHILLARKRELRGIPVADGELIYMVKCRNSLKPDDSNDYYHPDDVIESLGKLNIDLDWYRSKKIWPAIQQVLQNLPYVSYEDLYSTFNGGKQAPKKFHQTLDAIKSETGEIYQRPTQGIRTKSDDTRFCQRILCWYHSLQ